MKNLCTAPHADGVAVFHRALGRLRVVNAVSDLDDGPDVAAVLAQRRRERERAIGTGGAVHCVQLVVSNRCNFRCAYCFEGLGDTPIGQSVYAHASEERVRVQRDRGVMTAADAEAYLASALDLVRRSGNTSLAVQFFGGEPLLNWNAVRHVLEVFGNERDGVTIEYSVVTNGSIVTAEMADRFRSHGVAVIVSYDSPRSAARPMRGGTSSHDAIRRGLALLKRRDVRLALNAALTRETFSDFDRDLVDFAFDHGVYEIGVVLDLDRRFYREHGSGAIADRLWDVTEYGFDKGVLVTGYWRQIFDAIASDDRFRTIGYQNCSAMGVQLSIEPSGDVFACKASGARFGSILDPEALLNSETYRRYAMRACTPPPACSGCDLEHFCGGLCLGAIENQFRGDIAAMEPAVCDLYRELTRRFIAAWRGVARPR